MALAMGARAGTRPEDDPFTRTISRKAATEGQARMIHRMAARKYGPETADRLLARLGGLGDSGRLVEVGDWLVECESGEELLVRVERLCASSSNGGTSLVVTRRCGEADFLQRIGDRRGLHPAHAPSPDPGE